MLALLCALVIALTGFSGSPQGSAGTFTAPTNVMATSADGTITVSWTPGQRSGVPGDGGGKRALTTPTTVWGFDATGSGSSYECEGVTAGATYVVLVIALDGQGGYAIGRDAGGRLVTHMVPAMMADAAVLAAEKGVLEALYNATGGASWTDNTSWLSEMPVGEWHGVTTDATGRVSELLLRSNNLTGGIPAELGNLTSLVRLDLGQNRLTGGIPASMDNLTHLVFLDLDGNQLSGALPSWLGDLTSLEHLLLNDNQFSGTIPPGLGNLVNLVRIRLSGNSFTGCVPVGLRNVAANDLASLGLPDCAVVFSTSQLETLFDEILSKTEQREAFSEIKERNIGFSALEDMRKLRSEFVASRTETELYHALWKLSNARRDRHLQSELRLKVAWNHQKNAHASLHPFTSSRTSRTFRTRRFLSAGLIGG